MTATVGGTAVPISRPQQRAVLAYLLLNANIVVSADQLAEALWGGAPPATARAQVQACVSHLRRALRAAGDDSALTSHRSGYRLVVDAGDLDLAEFTEQLAKARAAVDGGTPAVAADLLRSALALWRGAPLTGAAGAFVAATAAGLTEQRLAAYEELADVQLASGRHTEVAAELSGLVDRNPLRERLAGRYMLALAGAGRQAEALRVYDELRSRLGEELGIEPGAELSSVRLRVLRQEVGVDHRAGGGAPLAVPAQLPADIAAFAGRAGYVRRLDGLLTGDGGRTLVITAIDGTAGVGKTALAVHWAHRVADRFPDGQLYVNLRGFDPGGAVMSPAEAIRCFLDALAVPADRIPAAPQAQVGLYRSLMADRRMLIVLDNARDADQVRPLLPGGSGCLVMVTSRHQLGGLVATDGAHSVPLDLLSTGEARELLAGRIGRARVAAEPHAVDEIIASCARLPLALAIVAARAATHPTFPLASLAAELGEAPGGLDGFAANDTSTDLRAVFSWSYRTLSPPAARLFGLLGLHPGPDLAAPAAASLAGLPVARVRPLLAELARAHLIDEHSAGRYTLHDLLGAYARELVAGGDPEDPERGAALHRLFDHYLHTACAADRLLYPHRDPIALDAPRPGVVTVALGDQQQALAWFATERPVLLAAVGRGAEVGLDSHVWQLAWALTTFFHRRGHWLDWADVQVSALDAARRRGDRPGQAQAHRLRGLACHRLGHLDEARHHLGAALDIFAELDDHYGQAYAHRGLGRVASRLGHHRQALHHAERALALLRTAGHRGGQANALNAVGWCHAQLGDHRRAIEYCQQAIALHEEFGDRFGQANTWDSLGYANHHLGHFPAAAECYRQALRLFRELGDRLGEADVLAHLGDSFLAAGDRTAARDAWQGALRILDDIDHPDAGPVRAKLRQLTVTAAAVPA